MSNITREDIESIVNRVKKSEKKKKVLWIGVALAVIAAVVAVFLYKKFTLDDEFEDDLEDDEFFEDFEDELEKEPESTVEDIFVDEEAEAKAE